MATNKKDTKDTEVQIFTEQQERIGRFFIRYTAKVQVLIYKLSGGKLGNRFNGGPVALVTMIGKRSGKRRTLPLVFAKDGDRVILAASQGGMSSHPVWYHNLVANPEVEIQIGAKRMMMRVNEAKSSETNALWNKLDEIYPDFVEYRIRAKMNNRSIPLLVASLRS